MRVTCNVWLCANDERQATRYERALVRDHPLHREMSRTLAGCGIEYRRALDMRRARGVGKTSGAPQEVLRPLEGRAEVGKVGDASPRKRGVDPVTVCRHVRARVVDDARQQSVQRWTRRGDGLNHRVVGEPEV